MYFLRLFLEDMKHEKLALRYEIYILFIHQQFHFLLGLQKFNFTLEYT